MLQSMGSQRMDTAEQLNRTGTELMLELKLQYFGHLMGNMEGKRRREWQRMRWLDSITVAKDVILSKLQEIVQGRERWHAAVHGVAKSGTLLCDCTTTI